MGMRVHDKVILLLEKKLTVLVEIRSRIGSQRNVGSARKEHALTSVDTATVNL
jgi:hypothetical protein